MEKSAWPGVSTRVQTRAGSPSSPAASFAFFPLPFPAVLAKPPPASGETGGYVVNEACLEKIVIPRSRSILSVSRKASLWSTRPALRIAPVLCSSASERVVLPASTWARSPRLIYSFIVFPITLNESCIAMRKDIRLSFYHASVHLLTASPVRCVIFDLPHFLFFCTFFLIYFHSEKNCDTIAVFCRN